MTRQYRLPPKLVVLVGPNKSKWSNSKGLEVDIASLDLNDDLYCLLSWQATQTLSDSNLSLGSPLTSSFLDNLEINLKFACPSLLCHMQESS